MSRPGSFLYSWLYAKEASLPVAHGEMSWVRESRGSGWDRPPDTTTIAKELIEIQRSTCHGCTSGRLNKSAGCGNRARFDGKCGDIVAQRMRWPSSHFSLSCASCHDGPKPACRF